MPQVEAAACGLQIASVDYSAMTEIAESLDGFLIPISRKFRELETNADRVYPCIDSTTEIMKSFFELSTEVISNKSKIIRDKCIQKYTWDNVYSVWDECFDSIDIEQKPSWNSSETNPTYHQDMNVPPGLSPKEFIEYVCCKIINEPYLCRTAPIQQLIEDLTCGLVCRRGQISGFSYQDAVKMLEQHLNNKIVCETLRTQPHLLKSEDYLECYK
jgi:hypothetical protein